MTVQTWIYREIQQIDNTTVPPSLERRKAYQYGDFAVVDYERNSKGKPFHVPRLWGITHLPTGATLAAAACIFEALDDARTAVEQIQALSADWANYTRLPKSEQKALFVETRKIGLANFGLPDFTGCGGYDVSGPDLNNYHNQGRA